MVIASDGWDDDDPAELAPAMTQARSLRVAHTAMAVVMVSMLLPGGRATALAGLIALDLAGALAVRHHLLHATGIPYAVDLAGMALLMAVLALGRPRMAVVVLIAAAWAISSLGSR